MVASFQFPNFGKSGNTILELKFQALDFTLFNDVKLVTNFALPDDELAFLEVNF